ncbi:MAG TPA: zinc ribbon domain-containing protein [Terriglobales bacterium]|nr:zinc ribbon domain-containing protein [Terriglobales bacterium]
MFCNACGAELKAGQQFCGSCGRPAFSTVGRSAAGRVQQHVQLLAILWLVYSALHALGGVGVLIVANTIFGRMGAPGNPFPPMPPGGVPEFLHPLLSFVGGLILLKAILGLAAGWGLLQREHWARLITLVAGFISLLDLPFGTALGIYTIWVLMSPEAEKEYAALATR